MHALFIPWIHSSSWKTQIIIVFSQQKLTTMQHQDIIIIGAGPVGLSAALLLANEAGYKRITIYEGRRDIPNNPEESYPIGINPRALHCLNRIDPKLEGKAKEEGSLVNAWHIYGGDRKVADLASGTVYGTTRGDVNHLLYQQALECPAITIVLGHRLREVDFNTKTLVSHQPYLFLQLRPLHCILLSNSTCSSGVFHLGIRSFDHDNHSCRQRSYIGLRWCVFGCTKSDGKSRGG